MTLQKSQIRNFCIISHIDHGKSTLADRFLELTKTVEGRKMHAQFLDMMELEKEKGITIKLQPVRMKYELAGAEFVLNLIDTPGHVDFSYEVSRSLAAVEGAVLLVDASQGVQAQTLANLHLAQQQSLVIIPVVNKIDLPHARTEEAVEGLSRLLEIEPKDIIKISAKEGTNVEKVIQRIIEQVPSPQGAPNLPARALIFDSDYDAYKGVVAYLRIIDGKISTGEKIKMMASKTQADVLETGVFNPALIKKETLEAGEIGYLATGLKDIELCRVGDTIVLEKTSGQTKPLAGYKEPKPMVFASFYPAQADDYDLLKDALERLKLSDAALQFELESCEGLGRGFRCGFLGMLHLEIVSERLKREHSLNLVLTAPSVNYKVVLKDGREREAASVSELPSEDHISQIKEPWVALEIITPSQYLGTVMKLLESSRGTYQDMEYLSSDRVLLKYEAPLSEIVIDFYDKLKNSTAGYASAAYEPADYRLAEMVKMDILVGGEKVIAFSRIVHESRAYQAARSLVGRLKEAIPPQLFAVPIQAMVGGRIVARETVRALRKDVIGHLYGGDYTRKKKLLEKQKKGKKKMKEKGRINIPQEVFLRALKQGDH